MRYSIMGFSQAKLVAYGVDMDEVLLLDYIQEALSRPSMVKTTKDAQPYVWLQHAKILEDLPVLNIKDSMLKKKLAKLVDAGLIKTLTVANDTGRGSRTYYTITDKFEELQFSETTTGNILPLVSGPRVKNYPPNRQLESDKKVFISKDINTQFEFGKTSQTKQPTLWDKCVSLIYDFTPDSRLHKLLIAALRQFIDNSKESGRPFYTNNFKGKLNNLARLADDHGYLDVELVMKIVQLTLDRGWNDFYEESEPSKPYYKPPVSSDMGHKARRMTPEQKRQAEEAIKNGTAEKF